MRSVHVINEDYEHWRERKSKELKRIMIIIIIAFAILSWGLYSSLDQADPSTNLKQDNSYNNIYQECNLRCTGAFSEGEEMTLACQIINDSKEINFNNKECVFKRTIYLCDCIKKGTEEGICVQNSKDSINC